MKLLYIFPGVYTKGSQYG